MTWLVSDARVLASAEIASTRAERRRGLLKRDRVDGALVIDGCRWVHTLGMRFDIDVAYVADDGCVVKIRRMPRHRVGMPVRGARSVIEAEAGAFERWGLRCGDVVEVRVSDEHEPPDATSKPEQHEERKERDRRSERADPPTGDTSDRGAAPTGRVDRSAPRRTGADHGERTARRLEPAPV